jgi:hypothetical protein
MDKITEQKLRLADLTIKIGQVIREKKEVMKSLQTYQTEENYLLEQIAKETELIAKG